MIKTNRSIAGWSVSFACIILLAGCSDAREQAAHTPTAPQQAVASPVSVNAQPANPPAAPTSNPGSDSAANASTNSNDKVSLASVPGPAQQADAGKAAAAKPKIDIQTPYDRDKPTLLGLSLKSSIEDVTSKYGNPKEQFVMDAESDPITVYDYADFLAGFNKQNQLEFIDVRSSEINPGLNGLKLGQSTSAVYKALGQPDSNTSFVFTYKSTGALLKLDIDPKADKVNSIKLFAAE
ncbi:DUF4309 domain-containing protein [Paenibacillus xerothermodurans]|nr:DUF4309 domain-containing protein [Paenibacillus xerothermodurans]